MPSKTLAIVGGETLLGRELREVLDGAGLDFPIRLVSGGDAEGRALTEEEGEVVLMEVLDAGTLSDAVAILLAGTEASSRKALDLLRGKNIPLVDLTGALEENVTARLRAPMIEGRGVKLQAGSIHVIAHPASIALALFLHRTHAIQPLRRSVALAFEPASERGKRGIDELHQQTVRLLSFQKLEKQVFDTQASFNLLSEYGEEAPLSLASIEQRIDRNLASLLSWTAPTPMPSLRLIQAPVFHGYSFSIWAEFEAPPALDKLAAALNTAGIEVRVAGEEPPTNAGAAGHNGITAGSIVPDRNHARAAWFWIVADNLRIVAENALEVVREVVW